LTVAFLPVFNDVQRRAGFSEAQRVMRQALAVFPSLTAVLTAVCIVAAEPLVLAFAKGFTEVPGKFELAVMLTRVMFPYLVLISFVALAMGALNARKRFASSAASPLLFNIVHIASMVTLGQLVEPPMLGVALGVLLGGAAEVVLQAGALWRAGLLLVPRFAFGPEVRRILALMAPAVAALAVYQINIMLLRLFASFLSEGSVTYLFNADRFMQLPLGVFAIAIATASLPAFSDAHSDGAHAGLGQRFADSWRLTNFVIVPAAAGLFALALPIITTVYQHGRFDHVMAEHTAHALEAFALGLPAIASIRVAGQVFFAIKDTRTPVACGAVGLAANLALAPLLAVHFDFVGLALSVSASAWLQLAVQLFFLRRRLGGLGLRRVAVGALRDAVAAGVMAVPVVLIATLGEWEQGLKAQNLVVLTVALLAGVLILAAAQAALRSPELRLVVQGVAHRLRRRV
ncbi:MAG: murein biosynthesis integral membrane protein MurJ, partial [Deltaproteobacteria bacterium]|nr:murein biosynthesis integral membrane protein MurJ [Deltaproteobacteria bacterium]